MKILDKYILKKFVFTFLGTLLLMVIILILSELTTRMNSIISSTAPAEHFYKYLVFRIPRFVSFSVPIAIMFATSYSITQLQRTNEMLAIIASGWSYWRAVASMLGAGIAITFILFGWNELVVGDSENISQREWKKVRGQKSIETKEIYNLHVRAGNTYYYFHTYKPAKKNFRQIHAIKFTAQLLPVFEIRAKEAEWEDSISDWAFYDGEIRYFDQDLTIKERKVFKEGSFGLRDKPEVFEKEIRHEDAMDLSYLNALIPAREKAGLNNTHYRILWHDRFAIPFVGLVVMLIGALIGKRGRHGTLASALGSTILVVLVYFIVQSLGKSFAKDNILPVWLGVWLATILYIGFIVVWVFKNEILGKET